ncbi:hypothetical protein [Winogradskyella algicola]|uniref:hypothetical protein n=1 Tax=Winogradskyella algicola TaxID=2575815 RepID=UPI0011081C27|nr:hypothetical protein [Winogradskyella algicola]
MKKLILILLSFVAFNLGAQEKIEIKRETTEKDQQKLTQNDNPKVLAKTETYRLSKQLNLSSEQQGRVYDIYLDHFQEELESKQKIKKLIDSKNEENKEEIKQKIAKHKSNNRETLDSKLKDVLTQEQFKSYQENTKVKHKTKQKKLRTKN